jgi:hypothetical protein
MQRFFRMVSMTMVVLGFVTIAGTTVNAGVRCCSGANCCTPSAGQCCSADSTSCWTYSCKPAI